MQLPDNDETAKKQLDPERYGGGSDAGSGEGPPRRKTAVGLGDEGDDEPIPPFEPGEGLRLERLESWLSNEHGSQLNFGAHAEIPTAAELAVRASECIQQIHSRCNILDLLGCLIMDKNGFVIGETLPKSMNAQIVASLALGVSTETEQFVRKLGHTKMHHCVAASKVGILVVADFGTGILVLITASDASNIVPLMRAITPAIARA